MAKLQRSATAAAAAAQHSFCGLPSYCHPLARICAFAHLHICTRAKPAPHTPRARTHAHVHKHAQRTNRNARAPTHFKKILVAPRTTPECDTWRQLSRAFMMAKHSLLLSGL
jgi:hypothetical protein